jgi:hypothetical protein
MQRNPYIEECDATDAETSYAARLKKTSFLSVDTVNSSNFNKISTYQQNRKSRIFFIAD